MEEETERRRAVETRVLEKVGEVIREIERAKHAEQVICALHSLAVLLFPIDSSLISGSIDEHCKDQIVNAKVHSPNEREDWWNAFYQGAGFPTLARVLLLNIAPNWLTCFPLSAKKHVYDVFFVNGLSTEVVQILVPCLQHCSRDLLDVNAVQSNVERLLVLCLLDNGGVLKMAIEFAVSPQSEDIINERLTSAVSRVAQIVTSIPDKARLKAPALLSSHLFFKQISVQLLTGKVERLAMSNKSDMDVNFSFVGEIFSRICRRGSSDVLLSEVTPQILRHVRSRLSPKTDVDDTDVFESNTESQFWLKIMESITDPYTVERISEQLLRQLATQHASDIEAYWVLWILFHHLLKRQSSIRSMFVDKFLLWKVFPVCCLRWILQFAVLECPPITNSQTKGHETTNGLLDTVQRLTAVWSKRDFVRSAPVEQQAYITAAVGLCLEKMSKEELDKTKDTMHSILEGVSCRLESPADLVRKMASTIALVFSKVVDPKNPLYLDDSCNGESIDWEFGLTTTEKGTLSISNAEKQVDETGTSTTLTLTKDFTYPVDGGKGSNVKSKSKKSSEFSLVDPDEIIDPSTLNYESTSDENDDEDASENSDSSDSSLQPYDLTDDDTDLKRKISQLVDVVGALRKSDDADGVERALDVAESLIRASPDELTHVAGDLGRTLVQVRCSDVTVEGEEESAEEKRQRALIALAAEELANAKIMKPKHQIGPLISTISEPQPWFLPSNAGPPGAGSWREISGTGTLLNWSNRYERELPLKPGQLKRGKTRRWSLRLGNIQENQIEWSQNKFPLYAAAFMLPAMQGFDKKRHGVDLLGRDFIVLGKLIYMLGVCMKCASLHPEASALAPPLLDMLRSRDVSHHKEGYVRRAVLFAASCVLVALHPSYIASSLAEGNLEISEGLEWIRTRALQVADSDTDRECYTMAVSCLQLHSEMALLASRALESAESTFKAKSISLSSSQSKGTIKIPHLNVKH
ncbi:telomere length regulation protein TEL2 homolog isoform X2 [Durio zibethinus]|uniref:Telomere length regulation protein TEL2 homolog isoform X2 n=1 Tax=Durio zibethinus TaxID=66656 RepID=A0A6P6AZ37_DURZI|nr:telomere length regulation protein TEL2 homolog isoform X2 [Durio zibethinus]